MNFDIIVPYRDRKDHLSKFIPHYRHHFPKARIIIVEQDGIGLFNRGALLNTGVYYANLLGGTTHVILHDVDMILASGFQHYNTIPKKPTMLATHVQQFNYRMPFAEYFGGVVKFTYEQFIEVNGYSNQFYGWGGEDNELFDRCMQIGGVEQKPCYYNSLYHERAMSSFCLPMNHPNYILWKTGRQQDDGISSLTTKILDIKDDHRIVKMLVEVPPKTIYLSDPF